MPLCLCDWGVSPGWAGIQGSDCRKALYQSGTGITGMPRVLQKVCRSAGILRDAVQFPVVACKQKGNFNLYAIRLSCNTVRRGCKSLLC